MWNPGISISCGMSGCVFFVAFCILDGKKGVLACHFRKFSVLTNFFFRFDKFLSFFSRIFASFFFINGQF